MPFIERYAKLTFKSEKSFSGNTGGAREETAPPVLSHKSLHIFISAASATTAIRMRSLTHASSVSCMFPGSTVVSDPNIIMISLDE